MARRFAVFLAVLLSALALAWYYVAFRLADEWPGRILVSIPFVYSVAASILLRRRLAASEAWPARAALAANGMAMGWISFALTTVAARDLALGVPAAFGWVDPALAFGPASNAATAAASVVALAWGVFGGLRPPRARHAVIEVDGLPPELDGYSIAQITDLHIGPTIRAPYVRATARLANSLGADAIALTGDIADGLSTALAEHAAPLGELRARDGVFYVPGNHEYYWDGDLWFAVFRRLGMRTLINEGVEIARGGRRIWIGGVADPAAAYRKPGEGPNLSASLRGPTGATAAAADLKILLAHQPNVGAEAAEQAGYQVQISGHTHGGQFFPWTLAVRRAQRFHLGLFRLKNLRIYVGPGTGSWGPPVRLGTRTEVAKLTFRRA